MCCCALGVRAVRSATLSSRCYASSARQSFACVLCRCACACFGRHLSLAPWSCHFRTPQLGAWSCHFTHLSLAHRVVTLEHLSLAAWSCHLEHLSLQHGFVTLIFWAHTSANASVHMCGLVKAYRVCQLTLRWTVAIALLKPAPFAV